MVNNKRNAVRGRPAKRRCQCSVKSKKTKKIQNVTSPKCSLQGTVTLQESPVKFNAKKISSLSIEELDYENEILNDPNNLDHCDDQSIHINNIIIHLKELDEIDSKLTHENARSVDVPTVSNDEYLDSQAVEDVYKASECHKKGPVDEIPSPCDINANANDFQDRTIHSKHNSLHLYETRDTNKGVDQGDSHHSKQKDTDPDHPANYRTFYGSIDEQESVENKAHLLDYETPCDYDSYSNNNETNEPYFDDEPKVSIKDSNVFRDCKIYMDKLRITITRNVTNTYMPKKIKRNISDGSWKLNKSLKECLQYTRSHNDMFLIGSQITLPETNSTFLFCDDIDEKEKAYSVGCSEAQNSLVAGSTTPSLDDSIFKVPLKRPPRFRKKFKKTSSCQLNTAHRNVHDGQGDASDVISLHPK